MGRNVRPTGGTCFLAASEPPRPAWHDHGEPTDQHRKPMVRVEESVLAEKPAKAAAIVALPEVNAERISLKPCDRVQRTGPNRPCDRVAIAVSRGSYSDRARIASMVS